MNCPTFSSRREIHRMAYDFNASITRNCPWTIQAIFISYVCYFCIEQDAFSNQLVVLKSDSVTPKKMGLSNNPSFSHQILLYKTRSTLYSFGNASQAIPHFFSGRRIKIWSSHNGLQTRSAPLSIRHQYEIITTSDIWLYREDVGLCKSRTTHCWTSNLNTLFKGRHYLTSHHIMRHNLKTSKFGNFWNHIDMPGWPNQEALLESACRLFSS